MPRVALNLKSGVYQHRMTCNLTEIKTRWFGTCYSQNVPKSKRPQFDPNVPKSNRLDVHMHSLIWRILDVQCDVAFRMITKNDNIKMQGAQW